MTIKEEPLDALLKRMTAERAMTRRSMLGLLAAATGSIVVPSVLSGCTPTSSATGSPTATGAATAAATATPAEPVKFAIIEATTGPLVKSFAPLSVPLRMAVKEVNDAGGILGRQINLVSFDDQGAAAQETQVAQNIMNDNIGFVIGPTGSSQTLASSSALNRANVIQGPLAADPVLGDPTKYANNFMCKETTDQDVDVMVADFFTTGAKKPALMYENTAYGQAAAPRIVQLLGAKNVTPVIETVFDPLAASMTADVAKVKATGADAVFLVTGNSGAAIKLTTAFIQQEYTPYIEAAITFMINVGGSLPEGVKLTNDFASRIRVPVYQNFVWAPGKPVSKRVADHCRKVIADPGVPAATRYAVVQAPFYDFVYILKQVIESAKSFDVTKVKKELENLKDYDGIIGKISFTSSDHHGIPTAQMTGGSPSDFSAPESLGFLPVRIG